MLKRMGAVVAAVFLLGTACSDDDSNSDDGGPCTYADYDGECTITPGNTFVFRGNVEGQDVELPNNSLADASLTEGETVSCTVSYITQGTCTPCNFDIGSCSSEAFQAQP